MFPLIVLVGCVPVQSEGIPDNPGVPPATIDADLAADLQAELDAVVDDLGVPGVSVALLMPGVEPWTGTSGQADPAEDLDWTAATRGRAASITKSLVAATLLQLAEEGLLSLSDTVEDHVPGLAFGADVTVRQVLWQQSGLREFAALPAWTGDQDRPWTAEELVALVADLPLQFDPGTSWAYSNANYVLASLILESVAGDWRTELQERCIDTAGMTSSGFPAPGDGWSSDLAVGYVFDDPMSDVSPPDTIQAAGTLESTPLDLARWADAAWGGGVFGGDVADTMVAEPYDIGGGWSYAAGTLVIEHDGGTEHGHNGVWGGFLGWSGHRPDLDASLGILVNGYPSDGQGGLDLGVSTRLASDLWAAVDAAR